MHKKCICSQRNVQSKLAERAEIPLLWLPLDKCSNTDVKLRVPRYFMRKSFFFSPTLALASVHPSNGRELPDGVSMGPIFYRHRIPVLCCNHNSPKCSNQTGNVLPVPQRWPKWGALLLGPPTTPQPCPRGIKLHRGRKDHSGALTFKMQNMQNNSTALKNIALLSLLNYT